MPELFVMNSMTNQTKSTVKVMMQFIDGRKILPDMVYLARKIAADAGAHGPVPEAEAVRQWVKSNITYRLDPDGHQWLQDPLETLRVCSGNCDCQATLAGALLAALGHTMIPLGVIWQGERQATHAIVFDATANVIVDPVADLPVQEWPPVGYVLSHFVGSF